MPVPVSVCFSVSLVSVFPSASDPVPVSEFMSIFSRENGQNTKILEVRYFGMIRAQSILNTERASLVLNAAVGFAFQSIK